MTDLKSLRERVEGQIWAAIRAGVERNSQLIFEAATAGNYEIASAYWDEASRRIADGVIARPDVQALLAAVESDG